MATFASLKTLHALIGNALGDIERVFVSNQSSDHSQNVLESGKPIQAPLDFPSPDEPYDPLSPAEALLSNPVIIHATKLIVSAAGQLLATVQRPSLAIPDATMGVSECLTHNMHAITFAISTTYRHACASSRLRMQ